MEYLNQLGTEVSLTQFLVSLGIVVGGTLIRLLSEKVTLRRLYRMVSRTEWNGDDILIYALRHIVTI